MLRAATHDPSPPPEAYIATSGGIFRDLQVHDLDAIRFVTGEDVIEVYADGAVRETEWFERHDDLDTAVAVLRLSSGPLAILSGTRHDPLGYDVRLEVFGTADSIAVGVDERTPLRSVEPGRTPPGATGYRNFIDRFAPAYRHELAAFIAAVHRNGVSPCSLADARAALAVAIAADKSRAERRPVRIAEVASVEPVPRQRMTSRSSRSRRKRGYVMTDELLDPIQEAKFSRRSLLVTGGLTAAGLTAIGAAPTVAFGANRRATATIKFAMITHGDTGSFWSVFKKGVDQATSDLKARGMSTTQVYANNDVAKQVAGINAAIATTRR